MKKHLTNNRYRHFFDQFPCMKDVLGHPREFGIHLMDEKGMQESDSLSVNFAVANEELLFLQNNNVGLPGSRHFIMSSEENGREKQVKTFQQVLFAIDHNGEILRTFHWPDDDSRVLDGETDPTFAKEVFKDYRFKEGGEVVYTDIFDEIASLVLLESTQWHLADGNLPKNIGGFKERKVKITAYAEPSCGFAELYERLNSFEHLPINRKLLLNGFLRESPPIIRIKSRLSEICFQFQKIVYEKGMRRKCNHFPTQDLSLTTDRGEIVFIENWEWETKSREITLKKDKTEISFKTTRDLKILFFSNCTGTLPAVRSLTWNVIEAWQDPAIKKRLKPGKPEKQLSFFP